MSTDESCHARRWNRWRKLAHDDRPAGIPYKLAGAWHIPKRCTRCERFTEELRNEQ